MTPSEQLSPSPIATLGAIAIRVGLPLIGVALLMTGLLGVVSYAVLPTIDTLRARDWQPVEATIESVSLVPTVSELHPPLDTVEIRYTYMADDGPHTGLRFDPHGGQYAQSVANEVVSKLKTSPQITVWVNPDDASDAMVFTGLRLPVLLLAIPAFGLALIGGLLLFTGMLAWNHNRLTWRPDPSRSS